MSCSYLKDGILKLKNVVVKLSNQGEIEIWDDEECMNQLKFDCVKLSNNDLKNIHKLVRNNWSGSLDPPENYSYLSDYLGDYGFDEKFYYDQYYEEMDEEENVYIELYNPKDLESHLINISNLLKIYSINLDDDFKILEVEREGGYVTIYTNITKEILEKYEKKYNKNIKKYKFIREQPIEPLWKDNRFIFKLREIP